MAMLSPLKKPLTGPDLVIGTGSHTHAAVVKMGKSYGAKKIICMSPPAGFGFLFDLCFVPEHDRLPPRPNFFLTIGPPNLANHLNCHDPHKGLILVGGTDPKSHHWTSAKIFNSIEMIIAKAPTIQWTISTSPRTPKDMEQLLLSRFKASDIALLPYSQTPKYWLEEQYVQNKTVWVTADSMSMVYEALSAGCNVGLIPIEWKKGNNKFANSEKKLISEGYVTSYEQWLRETVAPNRGRVLNEAKRCAVEILRRWWPERLP